MVLRTHSLSVYIYFWGASVSKHPHGAVNAFAVFFYTCVWYVCHSVNCIRLNQATFHKSLGSTCHDHIAIITFTNYSAGSHEPSASTRGPTYSMTRATGATVWQKFSFHLLMPLFALPLTVEVTHHMPQPLQWLHR